MYKWCHTIIRIITTLWCHTIIIWCHTIIIWCHTIIRYIIRYNIHIYILQIHVIGAEIISAKKKHTHTHIARPGTTSLKGDENIFAHRLFMSCIPQECLVSPVWNSQFLNLKLVKHPPGRRKLLASYRNLINFGNGTCPWKHGGLENLIFKSYSNRSNSADKKTVSIAIEKDHMGPTF